MASAWATVSGLLLDFRNSVHNLAVSPPPLFVQLSRKPALKQRRSTLDPTLRDNMENGMESTRARYTRQRRQFAVSIDALTPADVDALDGFVDYVVVFGALPFLFHDERDPLTPVWRTVRFSTLPAYADAGSVNGEFRQNCTFELREV